MNSSFQLRLDLYLAMLNCTSYKDIIYNSSAGQEIVVTVSGYTHNIDKLVFWSPRGHSFQFKLIPCVGGKIQNSPLVNSDDGTYRNTIFRITNFRFHELLISSDQTYLLVRSCDLLKDTHKSRRYYHKIFSKLNCIFLVSRDFQFFLQIDSFTLFIMMSYFFSSCIYGCLLL